MGETEGSHEWWFVKRHFVQSPVSAPTCAEATGLCRALLMISTRIGWIYTATMQTGTDALAVVAARLDFSNPSFRGVESEMLPGSRFLNLPVHSARLCGSEHSKENAAACRRPRLRLAIGTDPTHRVGGKHYAGTGPPTPHGLAPPPV